MRDVADFILAEPQSIAFDTLALIANRAGVHASTLVRFANHFGYTGFSEMQALYKQDVQRTYSDYIDRIREQQLTVPAQERVQSSQLLAELCAAGSESLQAMSDAIDPAALEAAVAAIAASRRVHLCGMRRAFGVVMYLYYTLSQVQKDCAVIDGSASMLSEQIAQAQPGDLLIAITFSPYSTTTADIITQAHAQQVTVLLITDAGDFRSKPIADLVFEVADPEVRSFRSLTTTLCLAQTLCLGTGYYLQQQRRQQPSPGDGEH